MRWVSGIPRVKDSIVVTGCFTHARRRFDAALTALKKDFTKERLRRMEPFPKEEKLDQLLPWSKELPEELRTNE